MTIPLEQTKREAQRTADRTGEPKAVLNLNRVGSPLYVIRAYEGEGAYEREGPGFVVFVAHPAP